MYIGKADKPDERLWEHRRKLLRERNYKAHWWRQLISLGLEPKLEVLQEVPFDEWQQWERTYIHWYRVLGWKVLNATDGGDGGAQIFTPEYRAKISATAKATYTAERRAAISAFHKGRKKSAEHRARISASAGKHLKGKPQSPEHIAKCRAAKLGKKFTLEHRAKISAARKGIQFSAETKAKMRAAKAGKPLSPAHVAALRLARELKKRLTSIQHSASLTTSLDPQLQIRL
ncbi:MAG: NUMOD3 domain-containing DNA-binding protein [Pseudomonadota bacterium]